MQHNKAIIAATLATMLAMGGGYFVRKARVEADAAPAAQPAAVPVVAGVVASHDVPLYLHGVGTVIAYNTLVVRSQIQGQITRIAFTEGQSVKAGDLLAQIDPRPYQAQLDQVIATRDRDKAQLENALGNLGRYDDLLKKGWATPQLAETQKAQVAQLQNAVKADEALIEAARVQLEYTRLTSSISGVTGVRQIDVGNIIHPTDPNGLVVVTQLQPISVIFSLPEEKLPDIQKQMASGPLTVMAYSQNDQIKLDEGKLALVDNEILQTTGTIRLKADFPNPKNQLWPGELVSVRLLLETRHDGMTVPAPAVQQGPAGTYAYVIKPDGTVEQRGIVVAQTEDGQSLVDSGLKANERVVVDGQYKLKPGSSVRILHGAAARELAGETSTLESIP